MYINHRRIKNLDSGVVHGVYPDNASTFCGFPQAHVPSEANPDYAQGSVSADFIIKHWDNWVDTDEKVTCKRCIAFLKRKGAI